MLVAAWKDIGVAKDGVVVHLAGVTPACGVGVELLGLVTAVAMVGGLEQGVEGIARLTEARGDWFEVDGMELVTAVDEDVTGDITRLDTAMDVLVAVVVVGVEEVVLELGAEEFSSALLRAW